MARPNSRRKRRDRERARAISAHALFMRDQWVATLMVRLTANPGVPLLPPTATS